MVKSMPMCIELASIAMIYGGENRTVTISGTSITYHFRKTAISVAGGPELNCPTNLMSNDSLRRIYAEITSVQLMNESVKLETVPHHINTSNGRYRMQAIAMRFAVELINRLCVFVFSLSLFALESCTFSMSV